MKKYLLIIVAMLLSVKFWAGPINSSSESISFDSDIQGGNMENMIPVTGTKDDDKLTLTFDKADNVHMTVSDKYGSVVYQNQVNSYGTKTVGVSLNGYQKGQYSINMVDAQGKTAVANFEIK